MKIHSLYKLLLKMLDKNYTLTPKEIQRLKRNKSNKFIVYLIAEAIKDIRKEYPSVIYDFTKPHKEIFAIDNEYPEDFIEDLSQRIPQKIDWIGYGFSIIYKDDDFSFFNLLVPDIEAKDMFFSKQSDAEKVSKDLFDDENSVVDEDEGFPAIKITDDNKDKFLNFIEMLGKMKKNH